VAVKTVRMSRQLTLQARALSRINTPQEEEEEEEEEEFTYKHTTRRRRTRTRRRRRKKDRNHGQKYNGLPYSTGQL